jgi:hypothetical protein
LKWTLLKACTKHHHLHQQHPPDLAESCRTHNMKQHDIFISYRVSSEGKKATHSTVYRYSKCTVFFNCYQEPNGGFCELLYNKLAIHKNWLSLPIYVFWDQMCLNDGRDWEKGFVKGLLNSRAVVLLISVKVRSNICFKKLSIISYWSNFI